MSDAKETEEAGGLASDSTTNTTVPKARVRTYTESYDYHCVITHLFSHRVVYILYRVIYKKSTSSQEGQKIPLFSSRDRVLCLVRSISLVF